MCMVLYYLTAPGCPGQGWARSDRAREVRPACSGGWKCAIAGVPWRRALSACLALGDFVFKPLLEASAENAEPSETPWHICDGTPTTA